jgi:hypothetical protein
MKNVMNKSNLILLVIMIGVFFSCEKTIYPTLPATPPTLVVEGWLNDKHEKQIVQLTMLQNYFNDSTLQGVSGATVTVTDDLDSVYHFIDDGTNTGTYQWIPQGYKTFGAVGRKYTLTVQSNGETYTASSEMNRTTLIDSITFQESTGTFLPEGSYTAQFWAVDPVGVGDTYWVRAYKNGMELNKPTEINIAYDAGLGPGENGFDGIEFAAPIRRGINPFDTDPNNDNKILPPYLVGDSVYVEIWSITNATFEHFQQVEDQTQQNTGFGALFNKPLGNVSSNVSNTNSNGSPVVGFFSVSAVKGMGGKLILK